MCTNKRCICVINTILTPQWSSDGRRSSLKAVPGPSRKKESGTTRLKKKIIRLENKLTDKGDGFKEPKRRHEHWNIDISYQDIRVTFYYLCVSWTDLVGTLATGRSLKL